MRARDFIFEGRLYNQSNDILFFFDINKSTKSFTPQQLQGMGLKQSKNGNWYLRFNKNIDPTSIKTSVKKLEQELNIIARPWTNK
jgi:hypothetical protein